MRKFFYIFLLLGSVLMAAKEEVIDIDGIKVPVIFEKDTRLPIVTMQFIFKNGGYISDTKKAGVAKFSSRVLNEGSKKLGSSAFAHALESRAITIASSIGKETLVVETSSLKDELDRALEYLDELIHDPNLSDETIKKVKTKTLGDIARKESDFDYIASNELKKILFDGTPMQNPLVGTASSVKSIELEDVKSYLDKTMVKSRLIIAIGGDVDFETIKPKLLSIIKKLANGSDEEISLCPTKQKPTTSILKKETEQAYIYFGSPYHISISDEDYYKAKVAMFILGSGGFGSRMIEEIRVKKGLAYSAYSRADISKTCSFMTGYLQTKLESMEDAKASVKEVVDKFVKDGVSEDELKQTKLFLQGSEPLRVETMSQRLNRAFLEFYHDQGIGYSKKELELIEKLSLKDLNSFIKKHKELLELSFAIVTR
ncbi:MAG: pitrilysin family protein [Sulfurimonadaceae bacterium]|jgi:predicted Zn-dependent peptidase|nr:pitrilysin family protein [Sulfurimonadaceae bacterium]